MRIMCMSILHSTLSAHNYYKEMKIMENDSYVTFVPFPLSLKREKLWKQNCSLQYNVFRMRRSGIIAVTYTPCTVFKVTNETGISFTLKSSPKLKLKIISWFTEFDQTKWHIWIDFVSVTWNKGEIRIIFSRSNESLIEIW